MEILKFDESGTSSPSRKRSGRGAILVTFVALVFGAGTALASGTLEINNAENTIQLTQGVAQTVQCDTDGIKVALRTAYDSTFNDFVLSGVDISDISSNCEDKFFTVKIYNDDNPSVIQVFCSTTSDTSAGCSSLADGGTQAKKKVPSGGSLSYTFTQGLRTGTITDGINVSRITVESSEI